MKAKLRSLFVFNTTKTICGEIYCCECAHKVPVKTYDDRQFFRCTVFDKRLKNGKKPKRDSQCLQAEALHSKGGQISV